MTVEQVQEEFPGWEFWQGFEGVWYARKLKTSAPVVFRAHNLTALRARIRKFQQDGIR